MNLSQAEKFKELYLNFIKLTSDLVTFIKNHQFIHGFQISTSEFYKSDAKTITSIEEYIAILLLNSEKEGVVEILDLTPDELEAFKEFEHEEMLKKASNSKFEERKASELRIEKLVSNQKAKEEVAKLVNSNINSPSKRKTSKSSKGIAKNWVKKPILITGINRIEEKVIEETLKNKYKETVLAMPFEKSDYQDLVDITLNKFESENLGKKLSFKRKNSRKESVIEGRKTSKMIKANFMPEFDQKIYETFSNGFSHMFSVQELQLKSGVKDDSMLNKAKKIFF